MSQTIIFHDFEDKEYNISVEQSNDIITISTATDIVQLDVTTSIKFCKELKRKIALAKEFKEGVDRG